MYIALSCISSPYPLTLPPKKRTYEKKYLRDSPLLPAVFVVLHDIHQLETDSHLHGSRRHENLRRGNEHQNCRSETEQYCHCPNQKRTGKQTADSTQGRLPADTFHAGNSVQRQQSVEHPLLARVPGRPWHRPNVQVGPTRHRH